MTEDALSSMVLRALKSSRKTGVKAQVSGFRGLGSRV